ncbi:MAG: GNAT family N-acetyltransferase [Chloroflexota bacterium]|nr:GNAT family N-acetyltransferase [Chloroflexota bacterium]
MTYKLLSAGDEKLLEASERGLFDGEIQPELGSQFLSDPRHHIAVAIEGATIVGFASAVRYIHPDKPDELWINEVAVVKAYRQKGIADALLKLLSNVGGSLGARRRGSLLTNRISLRINCIQSSVVSLKSRLCILLSWAIMMENSVKELSPHKSFNRMP